MEVGPHQEGQLCQDCPQGRPATIWGGRRIWMQYPRWFCRACWDEEYPAPVPGDRPPPLFQPQNAPPPKLSENKKAVRVMSIQERDKIIAEKKRLDENYRLLSYFSKFVHADAARSIAKKQIEANRELIEKYEEEEADFAEEEWALMED